MPCDCILIKGEVLVDENTLTGEVDPISKVEIVSSDNCFDYDINNINILYDGTKILNINAKFKECDVQGLVIRTGFSSFKGQIVRSFLFPVV